MNHQRARRKSTRNGESDSDLAHKIRGQEPTVDEEEEEL
jgi:hypothetical protein